MHTYINISTNLTSEINILLEKIYFTTYKTRWKEKKKVPIVGEGS